MRLVTRWLLWLCAVFALYAAGCGGVENVGEAIGESRTKLDFDTGDVAGVVTWNGTPITGPASQNARVSISGVSSTLIEANGSYRLVNVPPGSYSLRVTSPGCLPAEELGQFPATVMAARVTTADLDITASAGLVTGVITVNGVPAPAPTILIEGPCSSSEWASAGDGSFAHFSAPGTYTARVYRGALLGTFNFSVSAAATTQLGTIDFPTGEIEGTVQWNGAAIGGLASNGVRVYAEGVASELVDTLGHYRLANLPPANYALKVLSPGCLPAEELGQFSAKVNAGQISTANLDITASAGLVKGTITVNGVPANVPTILIEGSCSSSSWASRANGTFEHFTAPGTYTAHVYTASNLGTFSFNVVAGSTTDLGTIDFATGEVFGTVRWNSAPITGLAGEGVRISVDGVSSALIDSSGGYRLIDLPPADYTLKARSPGCLPAEELGQFPARITAGQASSVDLDITASAGLVTGIITVNGVPVNHPTILTEGPCVSAEWASASDGRFAHLTAPGTYTSRVIVGSSLVGTFTFTTLSGRQTDVDIGSTPAGSNVVVDLSGGIGSVGGISLTFSTVTSGGVTTVVESGAGPPPPTGFRIVGSSAGPVYWDIDTTALHSGPITVCIHYDENDVRGNEGNLRLRHDGGSGWEDITTSVDTSANIICGVTTSLSPFIVAEPVVTDADGDGVSDSADSCAATPNGVAVDARGCSIDQLVPCNAGWKNHGAYVSAFTAKANEFLRAGHIDAGTRSRLVSAAAASRCGR